MADNQDSKVGQALDAFTFSRGPGTGGKSPDTPSAGGFPVEFETLKRSVIRPTFESIGTMLKERGHEFSISEEPGGKISIHIVPAGVSKSIHPYDWFPTFSVFGAPFTGSAGLHGRNMRPNSEVSSGSRGDYKLAQMNKDLVEKELMKFIGEITNW